MNKVKQFNNSLEMYEKTFQLCSQLLITQTTAQSKKKKKKKKKSLVFKLQFNLNSSDNGECAEKAVTSSVHILFLESPLLFE